MKKVLDRMWGAFWVSGVSRDGSVADLLAGDACGCDSEACHRGTVNARRRLYFHMMRRGPWEALSSHAV